MEDNLHITPEQLTYLNENLDAVNEYVAKFPLNFGRLNGERVMLITRWLPSYYRHLKFESAHNFTTICSWDLLLEYVENTAYAPPILK